MFFYAVSIVIVLADQALKALTHQYMALNQSIPLVDSVIKLTYVRNTGVAFSLFIGFSPYLAVVGAIVVAAVVYFHYQLPAKNKMVQLGLSFILGGSMGNLVDRIMRGYVIDYFDITIWPVFNLADMMINIGVIMLAYKLFEEEEKSVSNSA